MFAFDTTDHQYLMRFFSMRQVFAGRFPYLYQFLKSLVYSVQQRLFIFRIHYKIDPTSPLAVSLLPQDIEYKIFVLTLEVRVPGEFPKDLRVRKQQRFHKFSKFPVRGNFRVLRI